MSRSSETLPQRAAPKPRWVHALLGVVLVLAGIWMTSNAVLATIVTLKLLGLALLVSGAVEIVSSLWAGSWGRFFLAIVAGLLYVAAGAVTLSEPLAISTLLTLVFAFALIASGIVRIVLAFRYWQDVGWLLLVSGLIGLLAGLVVWSGWPVTGLWVFGFVVGIDLVIHGLWWLAVAFGDSETRAEDRPAWS